MQRISVVPRPRASDLGRSGRAVRMAGSITDITERKQVEAALERYTAEIQHANQTLRIAEAEARKAVVKRDQFLAMLSHELRNPLSAIMSGVGVLDHYDADHRVIDRARQTIRRQVHHMSRLLDDLLDLARITQGKIGFRKQVLDLNDLLREGAQAMQPAMEARRQRFHVIPARAGHGGGRSNAFAANSREPADQCLEIYSSPMAQLSWS